MHLREEAKPLIAELPRPLEFDEAASLEEALYHATFQQAPVGIAHVDTDGCWLRVNQRLCEILEYGADELVGKSFHDVTHPEDVEFDEDVRVRLIAGQIDSHTREKRYIRKDGSAVWVNRTVSLLRGPEGSPRRCISIVEDITERKLAQEALRASEERSRALLSSIPERVFFKDRDCVFIQVNEVFAADIGKRPDEVIGRTDFDLFPPELAAAYRMDDRQVMELRRPLNKEERNVIQGQERIVEVTKSPVIDDRGEVIGVLGLFADITERKQIEEQIREYSAELEGRKAELETVNARLENLATIDGLTALTNHRAFHERLLEEFHRAVRHGSALSVIMFDVDWFKEYNDKFGHLEGDDVLRTIGKILKKHVRSHDVAARYGGEEFAVIMPLADSTRAIGAADRLRKQVERFGWERKPVTISVGVATLTPELMEPYQLLQAADSALYQSKNRGRNCVSHHREPARA